VRRGHVFAAALAAALAAAAVAASGSGSAIGAPQPQSQFRGVVPSTLAGPSQVSGGRLVYHGGPVMRTNTTYAIYWAPAGFGYQSGYESSLDRFLGNVAADSGKLSNVYAISTQYSDSSGPIAYRSAFAGSFHDSSPYPAGGCDDSPYASVCLTDAQIQAELQAFTSANHLPVNGTTVYFLFTPLDVGSCFDSTSTGCSYRQYCAYHGNAGTLIYANMPYADQNKANGACDIEPHPNGNQADATINVTSHEHIEAVTDPYGTGWYDAGGYEIADLCAWNFGSQLGSTQSGAYNQTIANGLYELQQEWSNSAGGCGLNALPPTITSFTPTLGRYGTTVTISGVNLGGATSVTLKNVAVPTFTVLSTTKIRAVVPRLSNGPAYWKITTPGGTVTSSASFFYLG
jgi:hypothetical protein